MKDIIFYKSIMFLPLVRIAPEFLVRQPSPFLPPLLHNIASSACWTAEYTVKIGNIIIPNAANSTDNTLPVTVTAIIFDPTVVTSINAHHNASP